MLPIGGMLPIIASLRKYVLNESSSLTVEALIRRKKKDYDITHGSLHVTFLHDGGISMDSGSPSKRILSCSSIVKRTAALDE